MKLHTLKKKHKANLAAGLASPDVFPTDIAFKLHDTYGFPIDLTADIVREHNMTVDVAAFEELMLKQKQRSRSNKKFTARI